VNRTPQLPTNPEIPIGESEMSDLLVRLRCIVRTLLGDEKGQDLVEYALVVGLISVAAVASLQNAATAVNAVIINITTTLNNV
jgi:pilus assembly protein Flp/PilA